MCQIPIKMFKQHAINFIYQKGAEKLFKDELETSNFQWKISLPIMGFSFDW